MAKKKSPEAAALTEGETKMEGHDSRVEAMTQDAEALQEAEQRNELKATFNRTLENMLKNAEFKDEHDKDLWKMTMEGAEDLIIDQVLDQAEPQKALVELMLDTEQVEEIMLAEMKKVDEDEKISAEWKRAVVNAKEMDKTYDMGKQLFHLLSEVEAFAKVKDIDQKVDKLKDKVMADAFLAAEKEGVDPAEKMYELMGNESYIVETAENMFLKHEADLEKAREEAEAAAGETDEAGTAKELSLADSDMVGIKEKFDQVAGKLSFTWDQFTAPAPTGFMAKVGGWFRSMFSIQSKKEKMMQEITDIYMAEFGTTGKSVARDKKPDGPSGGVSVRGEK